MLRKIFLVVILLPGLMLCFSGCDINGPGIGDDGYMDGQYAGLTPGVHKTNEITINGLTVYNTYSMFIFLDQPTLSDIYDESGILAANGSFVASSSYTFMLGMVTSDLNDEVPWLDEGSYYVVLIREDNVKDDIYRSNSPVVFSMDERNQSINLTTDMTKIY